MQTLGTDPSLKSIFSYRTHILSEQLARKKKQIISSTEMFVHKISETEKDKLESVLKNYCIQKFKPKVEGTEKENTAGNSMRRSSCQGSSVSKSKCKNSSNLSASRKSVLGDSSSKLNDSRVSMKSVSKNGSASNLNKFGNTNNSSGKKSVSNMYKSISFVSNNTAVTKIEDIEPMQLNF